MSTGRLQGTYVDSNNVPIAGRIIISPDVTRLVDDDDNLVTIPSNTIVTLVAGHFQVDVQATDDPLMNPQFYTYTIYEDFDGGATYSIPVPAGTTTDTTVVAGVATSSGIVSIVGPPGPPGETYTFDIAPPSTTWTGTPPAGWVGSVTCVDTAGMQFYPNSVHYNYVTGVVTVGLGAASAGKLILA